MKEDCKRYGIPKKCDTCGFLSCDERNEEVRPDLMKLEYVQLDLRGCLIEKV
jgi:hypothetical protein